MKREDGRTEMRWKLWLCEKSDIGVGETDGGDVDGWGDREYSTE